MPGESTFSCLILSPPGIAERGWPDELDKKNPDIGYMPGQMPWLVTEKLRTAGVEVLNHDITGKRHQDRKLITGDSPLASNNLGKLAAEALLREAGA